MINTLIELIKQTKVIATDRGSARDIEVKGLADFVTKVDMRIQEFMRTRLGELYPDIQFMSEEKDNADIDFGGKVWVLDPIDGTANLIHDYKMSAVSLGLLDNGKPVLGIVYNPFTEEMFYAGSGQGAFLNGTPISVTDADELTASLISVGTSPYRKDLADVNFDLIKRFYLASEDIRRGGSAALDLCYIAAGRTDGFFERDLKPWDYTAGIVIVREAGGIVTDMEGNEPKYDRPSDIVVSNGRIHNAMLGIINNQ
ncbi:MAG: inositol monophosphatase [Clostridia bacterium]|nr:inositol monophosphatase [Clostridia bacterium]